MTHRKTRAPDDSAKRDTEQIKVTHGVKYASLHNGRPRDERYETDEETRRRITKLLNSGHHEEDIVEVIRVTKG
jgi:hypothetical protein